MIAWSIEAALNADCFDQIIVSTDDDEIADVATSLGAAAPFRRAAKLADDHAPTVPVIVDTITRLNLSHETAVCCLYATAPFVLPSDLAAGFSRLNETGAPYVMSVTTYAFPIQRALCRDPEGRVTMIDPSQMLARSQDLEEAWHDAGQFYWGAAASWIKGGGIFEAGAVGLPLPRHRVQDIDTQEDWLRAEHMMRALQADEQSR